MQGKSIFDRWPDFKEPFFVVVWGHPALGRPEYGTLFLTRGFAEDVMRRGKTKEHCQPLYLIRVIPKASKE